MKQLSNPVRLKEVLFNVAPSSKASGDYGTGAVVGAVGALMSTGMSYADSIGHIAANWPDPKYKPRLLMPIVWREEFDQALAALKQ